MSVNKEIERIHLLSELEANWNSYGSPSISEKAIDRAVIFMSTIGRIWTGIGRGMWRSFPTQDGGVTLELIGGPLELELEFKGDGRFGFLVAFETKSRK